MKFKSATNDFVVKFANVNGSGSASANELFAKAIIRMGVPVSPRNIFPSNIQGLPTWYEARVSEKGWLGRRGGIDMMVAMNPQTWVQDVAEIDSGGCLFYDSTRPLPPSAFRDDILVLGMPITEICNATYADPRQRQLFKNILYVGALAQLLGIELAVIETLFAEQFKGKERLLGSNVQALHLGHDFAAEHLAKSGVGLQVQRRDAVGQRILVDGNSAAALGCVYGGATVCAWYPITPSTSLVESFEKHARRYRVDKDGNKLYGIVQAEDELAAIGVVIGASWNGARSFTATSGPGISLMSEFLGLAYFAEIPVVLFNVQRGGPSTGMPTRTQQSDIFSCAYASHGDTKHVLLFPADPNECFSLGAEAFDYAERLQTPVIVMSDLDIGMNDWVVDKLAWDDAHVFDRGKVLDAAGLDAAKSWGRYQDPDGDGIPYRTLPGTHPSKGAFFTRGTSHDENARYTEDGTIHARVIDRIAEKFDTAAAILPKPETTWRDPQGAIGLICFGGTKPAVVEALDRLAEDGVKINMLRIKAFPFSQEIARFCEEHERVLVVEQNRDAQMKKLIMIEAGVPQAKLGSILCYAGTPLAAEEVIEGVRREILTPSRQAAE